MKECVEKEFAEAESIYWLFGHCTSPRTVLMDLCEELRLRWSRVQPEPIQVLGRADPCQLCWTDYPKVTNAAVEEERGFS